MTKPITFDGYEHREMTDAEHAQFQLDEAEAKTKIDAQANKATAKAALLDRLGITADEAALLLG